MSYNDLINTFFTPYLYLPTPLIICEFVVCIISRVPRDATTCVFCLGATTLLFWKCIYSISFCALFSVFTKQQVSSLSKKISFFLLLNINLALIHGSQNIHQRHPSFSTRVHSKPHSWPTLCPHPGHHASRWRASPWSCHDVRSEAPNCSPAREAWCGCHRRGLPFSVTGRLQRCQDDSARSWQQLWRWWLCSCHCGPM